MKNSKNSNHQPATINRLPKVIVFGIDGGDPSKLKELFAKGKLPNLAKIAKEGVFTPLDTTVPPMTCPAWPSFYTGCNPGNHGIFDFIKVNPVKGQVELSGTLDLKKPPIWDIVGRQGLKSLVMSVPVTYPPTFINGTIISGYPSPNDNAKITYPQNILTKELKERFGRFRINPEVAYKKGKEKECFENLEKIIESQEKYLLHFGKNNPWDLLIFVTTMVDSSQHWFAGSNEEYIEKAYEKADKLLGKVVDQLSDKNTTIIVMSDHGFAPLKGSINLNKLFLQKGLLKIKKEPVAQAKYLLFRLGLTPQDIFSIIKKLGLGKMAALVPREKRDSAIDKFLSFSDVDFENSVCWSAGHMGQVHISSKFKAQSSRVKDLLKDLINPNTNEKVVEEVLDRQQVCKGEHCEKGPDLHIVFKDYAYIAYPLFLSNNKLFNKPINDYFGHHRNPGIFLMNSPQKLPKVEKASIYDITPTILKLLNIKIPEGIDGKTLI